MIEDILSQVKCDLLKDAISKYGLTETKAEQSVDVAKDTITEGFQNELKAGNISGLLSLFQGKTEILKNPIVLGLINQYAGKLISQLGLSTQAAEGISKFAIPFIVNQLTNQTAQKGMDEGGVVEMLGKGLGDDILKQFKGNLPGGLGDALGGFFK